MCKVLVTGTSGFIAHHLGIAIARHGHTVLGLDRRVPTQPVAEITHVTCDLLDARHLVEVVRDFAPHAVVHLAARTDLREMRELNGYQANIAGVEHLLAAIRATPSVRRTICTSSQLVCRIGYRPTHEEDFQPNTLYGESKVRTEQIWRQSEGAGSEWCLVRPTTIWGPGMNPHYLRFFRMIRDGRYFHVGREPTLKSYGYVGNTVHQYLQLLRAPADQIVGRVFYLADYELLTLQAWAEAFRAELGAPAIRTLPFVIARAAAWAGDLVNFLGVKRFPFNSFRLNNVLTSCRSDLSLTRNVCGDLPFTMEDGVVETTRWLTNRWST